MRASTEGSRPLNLRNTSLAETPPPNDRNVSRNLRKSQKNETNLYRHHGTYKKQDNYGALRWFLKFVNTNKLSDISSKSFF